MTSGARLSDEKLAQFDRDGYLVVEELFEAEDLRPLVEEINAEIDARARPLVQTGELSRDYSDFGFEYRLAEICKETDKIAISLWGSPPAGPGFFNLIRHSKLLDVAEQFCGPELIASSVYRLRPKVPGHANGPVPWHQDSAYLEPYCDRALVLTVWVPLVDATADNGCMWVMPGAHKGNIARHRLQQNSWYLDIAPEDMPKAEPVCLPMRKGSILLMTNRTPHASFENTTDIVRWSMDLRYQGASLPTNAAITRLPDEILPDPSRGIPLACYPPEADFLVRSSLRPQEVITDPGVYHTIRTKHQATPVFSRW